MKRLSKLDVHEVSLVGEGANRKRYLITKNKKGSSAMPTPDAIRDKLLAVNPDIIKALSAIAKSAVVKSDGTQEALGDEAQAALKAAGRILAPHVGSIPAAKMNEMLGAIGSAPGDVADAEAAQEDADEAADDAEIEADEEDLDKSAQDDVEEDDQGVDKADDEEDDVEKADDDEDEEDVDKAADEEDEGDEDVDKTASSGPGLDLPCATGPVDDKKKAAMAKAKAAYVSTMKAMGYPSEDAGQDSASDNKPTENTVAKSASLDLKSFSAAQRAALSPILKSLKTQAASTEQLRREHKEAVQKSAALQHKLDRKEFVAKAKAFPHLGSAEELGAQMHDLHNKDPETATAWFEVLKSANAAADSSPMFSERGSSLSTTGSAASKIDQAVAAIVQKSSGVSKDQATAAFLQTEEGRKLYKQDRAEAERAKRGM